MPGWRNGRREGLKPPWADSARVGSTPTPGTVLSAVRRCPVRYEEINLEVCIDPAREIEGEDWL